MDTYKPKDFWEKSHSAISGDEVKLGFGIHHVGGGQSDSEAAALYRLRRANARRILDECDLPPNPRIFELGSGGGYWVEFFRGFKPATFVGSDLSKTAVDRLSSSHPDYKFIATQSDTDAWSRIRELGPFDLSLAIDVLYHITDDNAWAGVLNQLCENTASAGYVLIVDYFYNQPIDQPSKTHVKFRRVQEYLDLFDKHNLHVEQVQPVFYFLNRTVSGPWRDHNRICSPIIRSLTGNTLGLELLVALDLLITKVVRPMNPRCKARFLLARKTGSI